MMKSTIRFFAFWGIAFALCNNADAATPLSQYGQIQNVQNYSSNPFWSPGQQYNKRVLPSPVYATGPDVETADCQTVVASIIAVQCAARNNCENVRAADIRPTIMLELSRLPGHNYASACAGYIDGAFEEYANQNTNTVTPSAFPAATGAAPSAQKNEFKIDNPYAIKTPDWAADVIERANELKELQSQNAESPNISATAFPTTINDVSFADRMENLAAGYAPYKDAKVYNGLDIESQEKAWNRRIQIMEQQQQLDEKTLSHADYCEKYLDPTKCNQTQADIDAVIASGYGTQIQQDVPQTPPDTSTQTPATNPAPTIAHQNDTQSQHRPPEQQNTNTNNTIAQNNRQHHGQCTPPDLWVANGFSEAKTRKYTTGRYFQTDQPFAKSMLTILLAEGMTCAKDPGNPRSITCYGYMQSANTDINVHDLNLASAEDRTYKKYYNDLGISKLPDSISGDVMHASFWRGPAKGIPTLCAVLGKPCPKRGSISDDIVRAAENYPGDLHNEYWNKTWDELRAKNKQSLWKAFAKRVQNARNNGCHVQPQHPVQL